MLIRSQAKTNLINFENIINIYTSTYGQGVALRASFNGGYTMLGVYGNDDRALEILDEIEQFYVNYMQHKIKPEFFYGTPKAIIYQMPEE